MAARVTSVFNQILGLDGVWVRDVEASAQLVTVEVALRRRRLVCPHCGFSTVSVYDRRPVLSRWRHLDQGLVRCDIVAWLRRLDCPTHGVVTEAVPFARAGSGFTGDFENLVAYLVCAGRCSRTGQNAPIARTKP